MGQRQSWRSASRKNRGAIKALGELWRLRINVLQNSVERRVGKQRLPIEKIGRSFDEARTAHLALEGELEIAVRERAGLEYV